MGWKYHEYPDLKSTGYRLCIRPRAEWGDKCLLPAFLFYNLFICLRRGEDAGHKSRRSSSAVFRLGERDLLFFVAGSITNSPLTGKTATDEGLILSSHFNEGSALVFLPSPPALLYFQLQ